MKIRVKFSKHGAMKFIGHLDIMRYFQKAIRRAEIPIVFTEGFSPHMVMSFASPLGVGIESEGEYMDIEIKEPLSTEEAVRRLDAVMSEGMRILDFRQIPEEKASNAMALVAAAITGSVSGRATSRIWTGKSSTLLFWNSLPFPLSRKRKKARQSWISAR